MSNKSYWEQRVKISQNKILDRIHEEYVANVEEIYNEAVSELERTISVWYQRFADNNKISLTEAKRLLKSDELKEFKWTVKQYIERGKENGISADWAKELENASARVHISRLESLEYQLGQYVEEITQGQIKNTKQAVEVAFTEGYFHTAFEFQKEIGVGFSLHMIDRGKLEKLFDKPWTVDNKTFTAKCWTNKAYLVESVNRELTRMIAIGESPRKAIENISKQFNTSKKNASRLIMTESAYFATASQKELYEDLDTDEYEVVETLDIKTCSLCGEMDGKVFKLKDMKPGVTAPPFHPWCRGTTAPYYEDMKGVGSRIARNPKTGKTYAVPSDMTFKEWRKKQDELLGEKYIDIVNKKKYNEKADRKLYEKFVSLLGKNEVAKSFEEFQTIKYEGNFKSLKIKYEDEKLKLKIRNGDFPTYIHWGRQNKHIIGANNYQKGKSYLYPDVDVEALIKKYAGTGEIHRDSNGTWKNKEVIKADHVIGINISDRDKSESETSIFSIHYSKTGVHIVPKWEG